MAHVGSFVPAKSMKLTRIDQILTRMHIAESTSRCMSTFLLDLEQILAAVKSSTSKSLVLLDEPFKGTVLHGSSFFPVTKRMQKNLTSRVDGSGLLCGLLKHFAALGNASPLVMVASHFHECFDSQLFKDIENAVQCFTMKIVKSVTNDGEDLVFLYKLVFFSVSGAFKCNLIHEKRIAQGRKTTSYGTHCARMNHVPTDVIERGFPSFFLSFAMLMLMQQQRRRSPLNLPPTV